MEAGAHMDESPRQSTFLYLTQVTAELARRWLQERANDTPVTILAEPDAATIADQLRAEFGDAVTVIQLPEGDARDSTFPAGLGQADVVLPLPLYSVPMDFKPTVALPDVTPHYATVRRLWRLGFRTFHVYTLAGTQTYRIPHLLDGFMDRHSGKRCFVIGNGPSLNELDLALLRDEITLGSNRGYLLYDRLGGPFTYWAVTDPYQIQEYSGEYEANLPAGGTKFYPFEYLPWLRFDNACPIPFRRGAANQPVFSDQPDVVYGGFSVTYVLLQLAAIIGCDPIYLIGVDHRYNLGRLPLSTKIDRTARRWLSRVTEGTPVYDVLRAARIERLKRRSASALPSAKQFWSAEKAAQPTHFDDQYSEGEEKRFLIPEPGLAERAFACADRWAKTHGRRIENATPGSALEAFPRVDYDSLF